MNSLRLYFALHCMASWHDVPCVSSLLTQVITTQLNRDWPLMPRDMVLASTAQRFTSDMSPDKPRLLVHSSASVVHPKCPPINTHVRMTTLFAGYVVEEIIGRPNACMLHQVSMWDAKGKVPNFILKLANSRRAYAVAKIRDVVSNPKTWQPRPEWWVKR